MYIPQRLEYEVDGPVVYRCYCVAQNSHYNPLTEVYYTILDQYSYIIKISLLNSDDFRLHCFQGCVCQFTEGSIGVLQINSTL